MCDFSKDIMLDVSVVLDTYLVCFLNLLVVPLMNIFHYVGVRWKLLNVAIGMSQLSIKIFSKFISSDKWIHLRQLLYNPKPNLNLHSRNTLF